MKTDMDSFKKMEDRFYAVKAKYHELKNVESVLFIDFCFELLRFLKDNTDFKNSTNSEEELIEKFIKRFDIAISKLEDQNISISKKFPSNFKDILQELCKLD